MKPQLLKVTTGPAQSFSVRRDVVKYFYNRWHYHPEIELVHIEEGSGTQFIGDNIQHFQPGDVLLVGANLPHFWRCDDKYFQDIEGLEAKATVVHFLAEAWGKEFWNLPENQSINNLFLRAKQGLRFVGNTQEQVIYLLRKLLQQSQDNRLLRLYQILDLLAQSEEHVQLSSSKLQFGFDEEDTDRINRIYAYSLTHFQHKISIQEVANVANISPNSFCRYFKSRSRKTYSQFLLELRVGHACKLLIERPDFTISQICFECGFNTFSNFNKYFKLITGKNPGQFQRAYLKV